MCAAQPVYIGTDGGATMSKIGGVWADGSAVSTDLLQWPTNAQLGPEASTPHATLDPIESQRAVPDGVMVARLTLDQLV